MRTRFTDVIGCTVPVQLAGMGSLGRPALAAAVASAGGLGMLGWNGAPPEHLVWMLEETRRRTQGVFGVNYIVDGWRETASGAIEPECVEAVKVAASRARVVEFFYGPPDPALVDIAHKGGALASWQVGTLEEARQAESAGCDVVVAQGVEAGGHVRGKTELFTLLPKVIGAVTVPVVAAGGIGTGEIMGRALSAGAEAVRIGTRFVAATESEAHPDYVRRLVDASGRDTVVTETFSRNWPHAPHRVLASCIGEYERTTEDVIGDSE
ncbi:MAG TPA: nitronate monooxygenase [Thermoplasmata archaeon]|nr:nitronate monooxygenase [Thermoplasmata archaeon]